MCDSGFRTPVISVFSHFTHAMLGVGFGLRIGSKNSINST